MYLMLDLVGFILLNTTCSRLPRLGTYLRSTCTFEVKQCKVRKGKITPTQPPPFPKKQINKKKGKIWVRTNEQPKRNESTRNQKQKKTGLTNSRDSTSHARYLTQNDLSTSLALSHARTHVRTTPRSEKKRQRPSIHPSIHSSLTTSHRKVYLLATKGNFGHGIRGREIYIHLSRPHHRVRLHLTSARLISAHRSRRRGRRRRRERRRRLSNQLYRAASDPIQLPHPSIQLKGM